METQGLAVNLFRKTEELLKLRNYSPKTKISKVHYDDLGR
jgi:hypothetical protein